MAAASRVNQSTPMMFAGLDAVQRRLQLGQVPMRCRTRREDGLATVSEQTLTFSRDHDLFTYHIFSHDTCVISPRKRDKLYELSRKSRCDVRHSTRVLGVLS